MIIIAVGFGITNDAYTFSCVVNESEVDPNDLESILPVLQKEHHLAATTIDELLIIENDKLLVKYDFEDGLGQQLDSVESEDTNEVWDTLKN